MRKLFFMLVTGCIVLSAQAPVYINLGSHNETNDPLLYQSVYQDYEDAKTILLQIADSVIQYDARWNMQVDANFIRGCIAHDTARTNPNNFLKWADNQINIEVDPHNHFNFSTNPYNPTDLNHLLVDSCLLGSERNNLGGFIWRDFAAAECTPPNPYMPESWSHYNTGAENGFKFPLEQWRPRVIWGGGSPSHCDDSNTMGIWKPDSPGSGFYTHNAGNFATVIGSNCGTNYVIFDTSDVNNVMNDVVDLINYAQAYGNSATDFYTLTVMFNFRNLESAGFVDKIAQFIRAMKPYDDANKIIWSTLTEKYDIWNGAHSSGESFIKQCTDMNLGVDPINASDMIAVFPNPASQYIQVRIPFEFSHADYQIIDTQGKVFMQGNLVDQTITLNPLDNGMYYLHMNIDGHIATKKILIQH